MRSQVVRHKREARRASVTCALCLGLAVLLPRPLAALSTAFTYQGQLQQNGMPANDTCDFRLSLHDEAAGGTQIGATELHQGVSVANGLFTILVNEPGHFGAGAFDGADRWLQVEVRCPSGTGSFTTLGPRQKLTATPYALYAPAAGVADDLLCGGCVGANDLANGAVTAAKIASGTIQQSNLAFTPGTLTSVTAGTGLTGGTITTSGTIAANIGTTPGTIAAGNHTHASAYWGLGGNAGTGAGNLLGTTDDVPLDLRVNNARALRLEPNTTSPNIIGGHADNGVTAGAYGGTVAGGGTSGNGNRVTDIYGTVGGGLNNRAGDNSGTTDDARYATVTGGVSNLASGDGATVGGGRLNTAGGNDATVAGGYSHSANGPAATIGGGSQNTASGSGAAVVGGQNNTASGEMATVGGGANNIASGFGAVIAGGGTCYPPGDLCEATPNKATGTQSVVCGGGNNTASGMFSTVGGGALNSADGEGAAVAGGSLNAAARYSFVGGGHANQASKDFAAICGGYYNVASGYNAVVGGGDVNGATAMDSTVGGGHRNQAQAQSATVSGGFQNWATAEDAAIGGGFQNQAAGARAAVGGGYHNQASANAATVPGGADNVASGAYSFAAGAQAQATHPGSFVWSSGVSQSSWADNTFTVRAPGGIRFYFDAGDGYCLLSGANNWQCSAGSDRETKTDVVSVNSDEVLERLSQVPIHTWTYRAVPRVRHIGPMAQDFSAAFGVGEDDTHINSVDADGVALAAIQALHGLLKEKDATIAALTTRLAALEHVVGERCGR